jgi:ABC-2 type transport system ATP-binding protein
MSEMALTADELIVVGRGRLMAAGSVAEVISGTGAASVVVRAQQIDRLADLLTGSADRLQPMDSDTLRVTGLDSAEIGLVAARAGIPLIELTPQQASLEEAFMQITGPAVQFHGGTTDTGGTADTADTVAGRR